MTPIPDILAALRQARHDVPMHSRWAHIKGGTYKVTGHSWHTEDECVMVRYLRLAGPNFDQRIDSGIVWDRPLHVFLGGNFKEISS